MKDQWSNCSTCDSEFKVISSVDNGSVEFCPFCGSEIYEDTDDDIDDDEFSGFDDE